jgi:hypothetical protein
MPSNDIYTGSAAQEFVTNTNKSINRRNRRIKIAKAMEFSGKVMTASALVLAGMAAMKIVNENRSED